MRHKKSGRALSRNHEHRTAMLRNMARSLLTHERIRTTEAKAKELTKVVDKLITLALRDDLHSRRLAYKFLNNHQLVQRLFDEIGPRYNGGGGGYTRILKMAIPRAGDCAPMTIIELTKMAEKTAEKPAKAAKAVKAEPKAEPKAKSKAGIAADAAEKPKRAVKAKPKAAAAEGAPAEEKPKKPRAKKPKAEEAPVAETKE